MDRGTHTKKSKECQADIRRTIIAPLFKKGCTYREMREEAMARLALPSYSLQTVKKDIDAILEEWRQSRIENTDMALQLELNRIDDLVKEAWEAWERSKEDYEKKRARQDGVPTEDGDGEGGGGGNGVVVVKVSQEKEDVRSCGDPRYIDTINRLLQERRKLLGLYSPEKKVVATDLSFANFLMKTGTKK